MVQIFKKPNSQKIFQRLKSEFNLKGKKKFEWKGNILEKILEFTV